MCPKQTLDSPLPTGTSWVPPHLQEPRPYTFSVQVSSLGILSWAPPPTPHASKSQAGPRGVLFQIQLRDETISHCLHSHSPGQASFSLEKKPCEQTRRGLHPTPSSLHRSNAGLLVGPLTPKDTCASGSVRLLFPPLASLLALCAVASCSPSQRECPQTPCLTILHPSFPHPLWPALFFPAPRVIF